LLGIAFHFSSLLLDVLRETVGQDFVWSCLFAHCSFDVPKSCTFDLNQYTTPISENSTFSPILEIFLFFSVLLFGQ